MARPKIYDDDLRERLIARTARILSEQGVSALSLRPLAAAEGTSTSAIYAMFGDKATLIAEACQAAAESFGAAQAAVPVSVDPLADLTGLGWAYRRWALEHPDLYHLMFSLAKGATSRGEASTGKPLDDPTIAPLRSTVSRMFEAGLLKPHEGRSGPELVDWVTLSIWAGVHGLIDLEMSGRLAAHAGQAEDFFSAHSIAMVRGWIS